MLHPNNFLIFKDRNRSWVLTVKVHLSQLDRTTDLHQNEAFTYLKQKEKQILEINHRFIL